MHKVTQISEGEFVTNTRKGLNPILLPEEDVLDCAGFAYDMTFGKVGEHKKEMSGSDKKRTDSEIFANVFQGKAGEFAVRNYLLSLGLDVSDPDLRCYKRGKWDNGDLYLNNELISVKSSPSYMNILKLNYYDYDENGKYKYANSLDDYIMYTRVLPNVNRKMRNAEFNINRLIMQDALTASDLERLILEDTWEVDIPGYITLGDFTEEMIAHDFVLNKGDKIDGLGMYAPVYYAQTGDLRDIDDLSSINNDDYDEDYFDL